MKEFQGIKQEAPRYYGVTIISKKFCEVYKKV